MTAIDRLISVARGEVGVTESPPGSNRTKYGKAYGWDGVPWCVELQWWIFHTAGLSYAFFGGAKTASCGTLLRWYKEQGQTVPVSEVQRGDIVILDFHGAGDTEHCGLVEAVDGIYITTIEGNTSEAGSQSNGDRVCRKTRFPSQIVGVCRPKYKEDETMKPDDLTDHWAEKSCRNAERKGIMKGYPDGTWQPDKPVTRAELAVILDRLGLLD